MRTIGYILSVAVMGIIFLGPVGAQQKKPAVGGKVVIPRKPEIPSQTDPKAKAILDKAAAKYNSSPVQVFFQINVTDTKSGKKDSFKGDVVMNGKKFRITTPSAQTYYDGRNQYVYVAKNNEVSISIPTPKELQEVNPAFLMSSYTVHATVQFSLDNKSSDPYYTIDVFPDYSQRKEYYKSIVQIDRKTMQVKSIKVLSKNGIHTLFTAQKTQRKSLNDAFFVFYPKAHPGVVVNDLR